jgi:hypothetical protein
VTLLKRQLGLLREQSQRERPSRAKGKTFDDIYTAGSAGRGAVVPGRTVERAVDYDASTTSGGAAHRRGEVRPPMRPA